MLATSVGGSGLLKFTIDDKGNVTDAVMVRTTGSHFLDEYTALYVKAHWKGPIGHSQVHFTEFRYDASGIREMRYFTPSPGYPPGPREPYLGRSCTVVVAFESGGCVAKLAFAKSTGNDVLDEHIKQFYLPKLEKLRRAGGRPANGFDLWQSAEKGIAQTLSDERCSSL